MSVNKEIIKQRKAMYGDNFECIAKAWSVEPETVCKMMANMKKCRIEAITAKLKSFPPPDVYLKLEAALSDSKEDMANYLWIAENYKTYKGL